ncbi:AbgT family transporter [Mycoplasma sp. P36-A1]|uniref:AbgT family transporter n=1 Tax=Mycoplasma sp. P36-A1 TaxID=3252900 RepID=UPI003C2E5FED
MEANKQQKLGLIERIGAKLPESNLLLLMLTAIIIILSFFAAGEHQGAQVGTTYEVTNLMSIDGFRWILYNIINNFRAYPPLGIVIVGVIGFGFAEKVGLLGTLIKKVGHSTPEKFILPVIVFVGINSSVASDAGYIVLVPLAGALYAGLGRNPLVGVAAAFASVSAGFGAALVPTPGDGLLGEITKGVIESSGQTFTLNTVTMNYLFMIVSTFFLTILLTFVTIKFVEKRASHHEIVIPEEDSIEIGELTTEEKGGLKAAGIALLVVCIIIGILYFTGFLTSYSEIIDEAGTVKNYNPILDNIIVIMICIFLFPSIAFGRKMNIIKTGKDYVGVTVRAMKDMAYIMVFAIFAGNFLAIFSHSGLDKFIANNGAITLINLNISNTFVLLILFMFICAIVNLFIGSASAKWTLLAPIFITMLDQASNGSIGPEIVQAAYRVADSATNIITPLMSYMGVILICAKRYAPKFELGDLISLMSPYSVAVFLGWGTFLLIYVLLGIPFGL